MYQDTTLSTFILCVDVDGLLTCFIQTSIEKIMDVLTLAIPGATPRSMLFQAMILGSAPLKLSYILVHIFDPGVLEHFRIQNIDAISF